MFNKCIYYSPTINCFLLESCKCKVNKLEQSKKTHNLHTANKISYSYQLFFGGEGGI